MQNIFSIPIEILQLNGINNDSLVVYAKEKYNSNYKHLNKIVKYNSNYEYLKCSPYDIQLQELNSVVISYAEKFASFYIGNNDKSKIKIEKIWVNANTDLSILRPHAHRESFLSAVYYPKAEDAELAIISPFTHTHLVHINPELIKNYNEYNSDNFFIPVKTGMLVIFNSMLIHYAKFCKKERISIAYDLTLQK